MNLDWVIALPYMWLLFIAFGGTCVVLERKREEVRGLTEERCSAAFDRVENALGDMCERESHRKKEK